MHKKKGQSPWTFYYHPKYSHQQAAAWEDRIQLTFFNCFPRRWWWPLSAVLSPTLQGVIKRTLNMLENIYALTLQEFVQMNAWFLDPQAAQLFQGWGNSVFGQDSNSLCLGNFKIKRQSALRVRWQVGKAALDHSLTCILTFLMYLTLEM